MWLALCLESSSSAPFILTSHQSLWLIRSLQGWEARCTDVLMPFSALAQTFDPEALSGAPGGDIRKPSLHAPSHILSKRLTHPKFKLPLPGLKPWPVPDGLVSLSPRSGALGISGEGSMSVPASPPCLSELSHCHPPLGSASQSQGGLFSKGPLAMSYLSAFGGLPVRPHPSVKLANCKGLNEKQKCAAAPTILFQSL